jgi:hypothetical protein
MPFSPEPCRLFVYLAREASKAVILRRGPSKWFRLSVWHTDTDTFEHGQWFAGKIFAQRCDLSPDGSLFLYFAAKHGRSSLEAYERAKAEGYTETWTAISKPPYFTALALWPSDIGTWLGGGLFLDGRKIWLNACSTEHHPKHRPDKRLRFVAMTGGGAGDMPVYAKRLNRDGWVLQPEGAFERTNWQSAWQSNEPHVWHKPSPDGKFRLEMGWIVYDRDLFTFDLHDTGRGTRTVLNGVTWADWDQRGRLAAVREGHVVIIDPSRPNDDALMLEDFNPQTPEAMVSPGWARRW